MKLIETYDALSDTSVLGGKAAALAALSATQLPIPAWFVVTPTAFLLSLNDEQQALLNATDHNAETVAQSLAQLYPSAEVCAAIETAIQAQGDTALWAVRSSAQDEDGSEHSFAGQLDSFLSVPSQDIAARVADVWRSGFSARVYAYRRERGISGAPRPPAVLIQRFIDAEASGVAFGADPVSGQRNTIVVSALYGLGTALVSGEADADVWHLDRSDQIRSRHIARKTLSHRPAPGQGEGISTETVSDDKAETPALTDPQLCAVAALVRQAGQHFGRPQDVEWAFADNQLWLLQSRPITSLAGIPDPEGAPDLWDNSNIAESYNGVTTPLTYSFARSIYQAVYRQFCKIMGVPSARIEANSDLFARMLGLIRGRIYYNLLNWYRLLALLPGYQLNSRFMEQMMGVSEPLPERYQPKNTDDERRSRLRDALELTRSVAGLIWNHFCLPGSIKRFYLRLQSALALPQTPLHQLRADELSAHYRHLERQLLTRWDAPLVNDFFAMIFYGLLRVLCTRWCDDQAGSLQNNLLCGEGNMISAEPAQRVRTLAETARQHPELIALLCHAELDEIRRQLPAFTDFNRLFDEYLQRFADRCIGELKLESLTLHDDPLPLLRAIGRLAGSDRLAAENTQIEQQLRAEAEHIVQDKLSSHFIRRHVFQWVLRHARARVRDRENLRFERTRLFGRVRQIFIELGKRFTAEGYLQQPRDIFYLSVEEALGFIEGTIVGTDLAGLVSLRKAEFARYRLELPEPANRFETTGTVHIGNDFTATAEPHPAAETDGDSDHQQGTGCCPGVVRGKARVIMQPEGAVIEPGEILVAPRTDPGWIMLFPAAAGLLVEHGSLLSHAAIVTREMGIPSIVALPGITSWVKTGDWLEMDGKAGIVRKITGDADHVD